VVGFVVDQIREKMEELKKGKSQVVEVGHTVSVVHINYLLEIDWLI